MPQGDLLGNFAVGDPRFQELKESRTGDLFPLDSQTGAAVATQDGIEPPNLGSDSHQWGLIYAKGVSIGGVNVAINDIANFAPIVLTREASAPDTGQHAQTFAWPFRDLTRAFAMVVGPQQGGGGSASGFYVSLPARLNPTAAAPFGHASDWGGLADWLGITDGDYVMTAADVKNLQEPGSDGQSLSRAVFLEGLSLGAELELSFGTGGAGRAGAASAPRGDSNPDREIILRDASASGLTTQGVAPFGFTHLAAGAIRVAAGRVGIESLSAGALRPANVVPDNENLVAEYRGYFDGAREFLSAPTPTPTPTPTLGVPYAKAAFMYGRQSIGGVVMGAGGAQAEPLARLTSTDANGHPGNPGTAGHNGLVLIFPRP